MAATLDGPVEATGAVFEAKFMLPWNFSEEGAAQKHMAQLQHNVWVTASRTVVLSIITEGGKWIEMPADPRHGQHEIATVQTTEGGEAPRLDVDLPGSPPFDEEDDRHVAGHLNNLRQHELAAATIRDHPSYKLTGYKLTGQL
jgi:hypothetical protein